MVYVTNKVEAYGPLLIAKITNNVDKRPLANDNFMFFDTVVTLMQCLLCKY